MSIERATAAMEQLRDADGAQFRWAEQPGGMTDRVLAGELERIGLMYGKLHRNRVVLDEAAERLRR